MSILIKGMKVPSACCDCDLLPEEIEWDGQWECPITEKIVRKYVEERKGKPPDCPLVEVPEPHGRLIDADKYIKDNIDIIGCEIDHPRYQDTLRELINDAPTVIEAEGARTWRY